MLKKICFFTFTLFSLFIIFKHDVDAFNLRGSFYSRNRGNIVYQLRIGFIGNYGPNEDNWQLVSWAIDVDSTECFGISGCRLFKFFEQRGVASGFVPPYRFRWGTGCVDPLPKAVTGADYEGVPFYLPQGNPIDIGCYSSGICSNANAAKIAYWENHNGKYVPFSGWHNTNGCPDIPSIPAPGNLSASSSCTSTTKAKMTFNWGPVDHGDGTYQLQYRKGDLPWDKDIDNIGQSQYTATGLDLNTVYYWRVRGHTTGNYPISEWTSVQSDRTDTNAACQPSTGAIGGTVYIDKIANNKFDPGEGYSGATVYKDKGTNNQEKRTSDPDYNFGGLTGGSTHDIKLEDFPSARLNVEGDNPKRNVRVPNTNANFRLNFQKYTIRGHVYWDPDGDGNSTTPYIKTVDLKVVGEGRNDPTDNNGAYTINGNPTDLTTDGKKYTLRLTNQRGGDTVEGGRDKTVFIKGSDEVVDFFLTRNIVPTYSLSGGVFIDTDPIGQRNVEGYTTPLNPEQITINGTRLNTANFPGSSFDETGFYVPGLSAGAYDVEFPLPIRQNNYVVSFHPGRYRITIGPGCSPADLCEGEDGANLDFGISQTVQQVSWFQGVGGYMRDDHSGSVTIPSGKFLSLMGNEDTPGLPSLASPGVVFNFNLSSGGVSSKGWRVKNSTYRVGVIKTSFDYITDALKKGKATQYNLFGTGAHCGPDDGSGCQIDNPNGGYYYTNGKSVTLDAIDFRANQDYIFRIDGNLTINTGATPWNVANGTTAIFVVKGNIIVNSNVTHLEGIFSADGDFRVNSKAPADDSQLIIEGSVIANAKRNSANTKPFDNQRDLGNSNGDTPSVKIIYRPDFVLNAPNIVRYSNYNFQEVAPSGQ